MVIYKNRMETFEKLPIQYWIRLINLTLHPKKGVTRYYEERVVSKSICFPLKIWLGEPRQDLDLDTKIYQNVNKDRMGEELCGFLRMIWNLARTRDHNLTKQHFWVDLNQYTPTEIQQELVR